MDTSKDEVGEGEGATHECIHASRYASANGAQLPRARMNSSHMLSNFVMISASITSGDGAPPGGARSASDASGGGVATFKPHPAEVNPCFCGTEVQ